MDIVISVPARVANLAVNALRLAADHYRQDAVTVAKEMPQHYPIVMQFRGQALDADKLADDIEAAL